MIGFRGVIIIISTYFINRNGGTKFCETGRKWDSHNIVKIRQINELNFSQE